MDPSSQKPDPYHIAGHIPLGQRVSGLGYIWATKDNVEAVKQGHYSALRPVAAELDLSTMCVYDCAWCAYRAAKRAGGTRLDDATIATEIVAKLSAWGVRLLVLTGGGEPLLSSVVAQTIREARRVGMHVTLYTNGFLLDRDHVEALLAANVSEVRLSLNDLSSEAAYQEAHGPKASRAVVLRHLVELLKARARAADAPTVGTSFVLADSSARNIAASLGELERCLQDAGVSLDYTLIRPAVNYWPVDRRGYGQYLSNPHEARKAAERAHARHAATGPLGEIFLSSLRFLAVHHEQQGPLYSRCRAAGLWLNVGPDTTAYLCCETKHQTKFRIGSLRENNLDELVDSGIARHMREKASATDRCPTRLCKPAEQNVLFDQIEAIRARNAGTLPAWAIEWLDEMASWAAQLPASGSLPSVAGRYE